MWKIEYLDCFPPLTSAFMQIDSLTMFADKMQTISRTYIMSNFLSYYPPFFYTILLSLFFTAFVSFFLHAFSTLCLSLNQLLESVFVPLNTIEKSIEICSTIFHSEKDFLGVAKKNRGMFHSLYLSYSKYECSINNCTKYPWLLNC